MPSDEQFEAMQRRVEALEGQVGEYRGRPAPSADEIQDYVKVRDALTRRPVDLTADEIRHYLRVRDYLLEGKAVGHKGIPTCGASRPLTGDGPDAADLFGNFG